VSAAVHASARCLDVPGDSFLTVNEQSCIAIKRRQDVTRRQGKAEAIEHD